MGRDGSGVSEHAGKVRVSFMFEGERCRETWDLKWSVSNKNAATADLKNIRREIADGTFNYSKWFPNSRKVKTGAVPRSVGARALTLGQAIADFLGTKGRKAENTKKLYRNAGEVWKVIFGAETTLAELTPTKVETTIGRHPFASSKLRNDYLIVLRGAFRLAHKTDKSWPNPVDDVENEKRADPVPKPVDHVQQAKILAHMHTNFDERVVAYMEFQFETGCRPEETIALTWGDVLFKQRKVHIQRARSLGHTGSVKNFENRYIDLSVHAMQALQTMMRYTHRARSPELEVFQNPNTGKPWNDSRSQNDHYWKPTLKALGIPARRAYNTRHTFASLRLSMGADVYYVSKQLGHKSIATTMKTYALYIDDAKKEADRVRGLMTGLRADAVNEAELNP
ncbi:MAG: tyrosine-type recombinase/integrase [Pseudomonadota bacterium]